ncbi:MAG: DNA-binding transcriptional LysR family regulator [Pseudorhodobacter sp.]|jgi:DNA-binding transcriptional LysR family regulator
MPMQTDQIETFLDLVETRSFNRTAERLGLTQSSVSGRVTAMETALGVRLFTRSRAGTELTTEGLKFEPHARRLRHAWAEARHSVTATGDAVMNIRLGIQSDLGPEYLGDWMQGFRANLPDCAFYIEADFSAQMCRDLISGVLDFAVLYTPHSGPDLHFTTLGVSRYWLISSETDQRAGLRVESYIRANYAAAFDMVHRAAVPELQHAPVAAGQSATILGLLTKLGGSAYVIEHRVQELLDTGDFRLVKDTPSIEQPVHAATHLRHRTSKMHRRLLQVVQKSFAASPRIRPGNLKSPPPPAGLVR